MQPLKSPCAENRKGCCNPTLSAARLGVLEPRCDTRRREENPHWRKECLTAKIAPGTSALELFSSIQQWPLLVLIRTSGCFLLLLFLPCCCCFLQQCPGLQAPFPKGKVRAVEVEVCLQEAGSSIPKLMGLFWHVQKVCVEKCDEIWPNFMK